MRPLRRAFALALVLLSGLGAGILLASCGSDEDTATGPTVTETQTTQPSTQTETTTEPAPPTEKAVRVDVVDGTPEGGIVRETVKKGDHVVLLVASDVADEIHLHGYDLSHDVDAGGTARIRFTANVPGRFEVELEERGVQIAELTVQP